MYAAPSNLLPNGSWQAPRRRLFSVATLIVAALMLRSIAARSEHICSTRRMRRDASRSMSACAAAVLILRDARAPAGICGHACAFALLRMRTAIASEITSHDVKQPISFPRRVFCARGLQLWLRAPRMKGWRSAESRTGARTPVGLHLTRQPTHLPRRLAPHNPGPPPLAP